MGKAWLLSVGKAEGVTLTVTLLYKFQNCEISWIKGTGIAGRGGGGRRS